MTRRVIGSALIAAVLLIAVVVPGLQGRTVSGTPQATAVPERPSVGDCVSGPIYPGGNHSQSQPAKPGVTVSTYAYPVLTIGPCRGARSGEVVSVIANPMKPVVTSTTDGAGTSVQIQDSNMDACSPAAFSYAGMAMAGPQPAPILTNWYQMIAVLGVAASSPSVRQQAAGQHWLACIVYVQPSGGTATEIAAQERYEQSLRQAMTNGHERNRLGICYTDTELNPSTGSNFGACGTAHRSEVFGGGSVDSQAVSRSVLENSCRRLVQQVTGIPNVGADGIAAQMQADDGEGHRIRTTQIPAHSNVACGVVVTDAKRHLTSSLLAWGRQPLPWA